MSKEWERKFKKIMRKSGMEHLLADEAGRFKGLIKRDNSGESAKEKFYAAICHDSSLPDGKRVFLYDKFRTKAERDKWYDESGRKIEEVHGVKMEMPEEPMNKEEIKSQEQKSGY